MLSGGVYRIDPTPQELLRRPPIAAVIAPAPPAQVQPPFTRETLDWFTEDFSVYLQRRPKLVPIAAPQVDSPPPRRLSAYLEAADFPNVYLQTRPKLVPITPAAPVNNPSPRRVTAYLEVHDFFDVYTQRRPKLVQPAAAAPVDNPPPRRIQSFPAVDDFVYAYLQSRPKLVPQAPQVPQVPPRRFTMPGVEEYFDVYLQRRPEFVPVRTDRPPPRRLTAHLEVAEFPTLYMQSRLHIVQGVPVTVIGSATFIHPAHTRGREHDAEARVLTHNAEARTRTHESG